MMWSEVIRKQVRTQVLNFPYLGSVYRDLRGRQIELRYEWWKRKYASGRFCSQGAALKQRSEERLDGFCRASRPRALFLGTDESQDRSGMLQGLASEFDVTAFTSEQGEYGWTRLPSPLSVRAENVRRLHQLLGAAEAEGSPYHLVIGQMWGGLHPEQGMKEAHRRHQALFVNICMDDRHTYGPVYRSGVRIGTRYLDPIMDLVLTAAPECVSWHNLNQCPSEFFPEASDPEVFGPISAGKKTIDALFVGQRYGRRGKFIESLIRAGIRVEAFGDGWPNGRLPIDDTPRIHAESKIVLGHSAIAYCQKLKALKLRDFDGPMSGSFYLTEANPDLELLYRIPEEIDVYTDAESCIGKCRYYLSHESEREAIAARGRQKVIKCHTWQRRFAWLNQWLRSAASGALNEGSDSHDSNELLSVF